MSALHSRREFLQLLGFSGTLFSLAPASLLAHARPARIRLGLVTYLWGKDWDLPTLIHNCEIAGLGGVELRTEHKHGVEPVLNAVQRQEVKKRFADSKVICIGYGANDQYDSPHPAILKKNMDHTKALLQLSHDIGASGVKVKPNAFHDKEGIPREKTIEQIGQSLNELGQFAGNLGQTLRLEVHGEGTQELPNIKAIMDQVESPHVGVCWNCNPEDLMGGGLEYNFNLVKNRLGDTVHVRELDSEDYPYQQLMNLLVKTSYQGWILLECRTDPVDKVAALIAQRKIWEHLVQEASKT